MAGVTIMVRLQFDCSSTALRQLRHFFAVRIVWNSLPDEVVSTNQLSRFKTHIKQIHLNNFLIGKA